MNVLFLNPTGRMGGAEAALLEVMTGLTERHPTWRLALIVASDGALVTRAQALGVEVRVLPFPSAVARLGEWGHRENWRSRARHGVRFAGAIVPAGRYAVRLRQFVRAFAPDVVHSNGMKMHVLGEWARRRGTPLVWHHHDYLRRGLSSAYLLSALARNCACLIVPSQSVANDVGRLGRNAPPTRAIWNSVDLRRFSPKGERLDLDGLSALPRAEGAVVRVGLLATFARWKGHHVFLDAISRLPPALAVRAYVIGGPIYDAVGSQVSLEELRAAAARLGLAERIGFTGYVENPAAAIRALDILVHASTEPEPFGLAVAEGMACGRPVIVSVAGGAAEIITPNVDALPFAPGDAAGLARTIETLASDPNLRHRLARAARQTAENSFSRERLAREIDDVYEGIAPSERLRVLHVHSGNLYGGVETFLRTLARDGGAARQMVSTFALCFDGALSKELRALGSSPHMLGVVRLRHPFTVRRARRSLARLLARQRFDVIACHQAWAYAIFAPTIRRAGLPLVFWQHTADDGRHWLARLARRVSPDLAVACSQYATERLSRWFPNARKLTIFCPLHTDASPTCDTVSRAALRRSLDTAPDDLVVVQVGRLDPDKGNRETLEALASLRDLGCWTYWMVGGPQSVAEERYLRDLMTLGRRHGISDRVRFVGQRQDVAALLDAADVYCQPNVRPEPFGLSLVEAQAAGLPIVTSAIGGAFEIVTEACGMLVPPDDIGALSDALRRLLTDAKLRARLGAAGRDAGPALCDVRRQMQRISDVLLDVADRHRRSSLAAGATPLQASPRS